MIGQRVRRREDPRFLTGHGHYVDDMRLQGARHVQFVRSDAAHATIESVDTSAVAGLDGPHVVVRKTSHVIALAVERRARPRPPALARPPTSTTTLPAAQ